MFILTTRLFSLKTTTKQAEVSPVQYRNLSAKGKLLSFFFFKRRTCHELLMHYLMCILSDFLFMQVDLISDHAS